MVIFAILMYRRYGGGSSELSIVPLVITVLIILESIFSFLRIDAIFPVFRDKANLNAFVIYCCLGTGLMISAFWIFALKYHETAISTHKMLTTDQFSVSSDSVLLDSVRNRTKQREKTYEIVMLIFLAYVWAN